VPTFLSALLLAALLQWAPEPPSLVDAVVNQVIDGNTLDAQIDGIRTPVGYLGIETPGPGQPCGLQAIERNRQLAGQHVWLESDPAYQLDSQHRRLFYVYADDGTWIESTLISEGLAHAARTDAARGAELVAAEAEAQANAQGCLWAALSEPTD
jgi:endonuclease YncB( thermonuclease family)